MSANRSLLRVGTRGSALARWQAEWVAGRLSERGHKVELIEILTTGDLRQDIPLGLVQEEDFFTRQLDEALRERRIDVAVHSLKDLPIGSAEGVVLAAIGPREDPREALVGRAGRSLGWSALPPGATLATCSQRRRAQALRARSDLVVVDVRGNVDGRLRQLDASGEWDVLLLAVAGLVRLGLEHRIDERLPLDLILPAPGQAALAATVRDDDRAAFALVRGAMHHVPTALATLAERGLLQRFDGGGQGPVAAHGEVRPGVGGFNLRLHGRVLSWEGREMVELSAVHSVRTEADATAVGRAVAEGLLARGGGRLLAPWPRRGGALVAGAHR